MAPIETKVDSLLEEVAFLRTELAKLHIAVGGLCTMMAASASVVAAVEPKKTKAKAAAKPSKAKAAKVADADDETKAAAPKAEVAAKKYANIRLYTIGQYAEDATFREKLVADAGDDALNAIEAVSTEVQAKRDKGQVNEALRKEAGEVYKVLTKEYKEGQLKEMYVLFEANK